MKNLRTTVFSILVLYVCTQVKAQVDIQHDGLGVNICQPISDVGINTVGSIENAVEIQSTFNGSLSTALYARAYEVPNGSSFTTGIVGIADLFKFGNRARGVVGYATRDLPYSNGRSTGVLGLAGNSTPGANYGVFGRLWGSNVGAGIVGYDGVAEPNWSLVLPAITSYAGYFRGKGYFHDNLGVGQEDPKEKLHIANGNLYLETAGNGIILNNGTDCYILTIDAAGVLQTTITTCP